MAHTNSTTNYNLPQFIGTDKPTWLGDVNGAMLAIDTAIAGVASTATGADTKADTAITTANAAASAASDAATLANTANTNANSAITTAGNAASAAQSVDTKVGALSDLTTTDKTSIVAAINEVDGKATPDAGDIDYDNTTSGLAANNVQAAIDEIVASVPTGGVTVVDITNGTIADGAMVVTPDVPAGKTPFAFVLTGATTTTSGVGAIWKNLTNQAWCVSVYSWATMQLVNADTNVSGKLLCI